MTPTSPLTYVDFISQVEGVMLPDSPLRVASESNSLLTFFSGADKANSDFKFEDIEVGKIYVFWVAQDAPYQSPKRNHLWFMTPYNIQNEHDYSLHWCRYTKRTGEMRESSGLYWADEWDGKIWSGSRWKVLNTPPFTHETFMNWINENPLEVK